MYSLNQAAFQAVAVSGDKAADVFMESIDSSGDHVWTKSLRHGVLARWSF